ncbi:hypothetical protein [Streptomyces collinus]|uniref:hypothetical protein n=1 Tax=Streptomyces collinus TaxID=42684 RepID=UPI00362932FC
MPLKPTPRNAGKRLMFPFSRLAATVTATATAATALSLLGAGPTSAVVAPPLSDARVVAHYTFNNQIQQTPENIVLEPDGTADITFSLSRQVVHVTNRGTSYTVRATLPAVSTPHTPILGQAAVMGIARAGDGTLYVNYATGTSRTGIWRISPGRPPVQIAQLPNPTHALPNGLALDERHHVLYMADTVGAVVWRIPQVGGTPRVWASGAALQPSPGASLPAGPNGLRVHNGAVWVSNTTRGTLLRVPVLRDGAAGKIQTRATGLDWIDDFAFTGTGDTVLAALVAGNSISSPPDGDTGSTVLVSPKGGHKTVLTHQDGLNSPSSVAVSPRGRQGRTVFVLSAAYFSNPPDPNLLRARLKSAVG